ICTGGIEIVDCIEPVFGDNRMELVEFVDDVGPELVNKRFDADCDHPDGFVALQSLQVLSLRVLSVDVGNEYSIDNERTRFVFAEVEDFRIFSLGIARLSKGCIPAFANPPAQ
ncbi:unnamed protein product, partial [Didymodactylos carnosus]